MTDDERNTYDSRRIDGLVSATAKLEEQQIAGRDDREDLRDFIGAVERRLTKHVDAVEKGCLDFRDEYRADRKAALERSDSSRASSRMVVVAMIAGSCTVLAAIIAAIAAVLTGG